MRDAADLGCIEAQLYLGIAHTLGSLFEPDIVFIARVPFHIPEYADGGIYIEGSTPGADDDEELRYAAVRFDPGLAHSYFRDAARHSPEYVEELSAKGKYLYARCFIDGVGVDFNLNVANKLMVDAAASGSAEALTYLETDAPYMTPVPFRGKRCTSDLIQFTAEKIAAERNMTTQQLCDITKNNTLTLFTKIEKF